MEKLILEELQAFRRDMGEWQRVTERTLGGLETDMHALIGNGNPGRIGKLEESVTDLQHAHWKFTGIVMGVSTLFTGIWEYLKHRP